MCSVWQTQSFVFMCVCAVWTGPPFLVQLFTCFFLSWTKWICDEWGWYWVRSCLTGFWLQIFDFVFFYTLNFVWLLLWCSTVMLHTLLLYVGLFPSITLKLFNEHIRTFSLGSAVSDGVHWRTSVSTTWLGHMIHLQWVLDVQQQWVVSSTKFSKSSEKWGSKQRTHSYHGFLQLNSEHWKWGKHLNEIQSNAEEISWVWVFVSLVKCDSSSADEALMLMFTETLDVYKTESLLSESSLFILIPALIFINLPSTQKQGQRLKVRLKPIKRKHLKESKLKWKKKILWGNSLKLKWSQRKSPNEIQIKVRRKYKVE